MDIVTAALALDELSINWQVELTPTDAYRFASEAGAYNNFTNIDLVEMLRKITRHIPPMDFPGDNPNNGLLHHTFTIGNEGSRVVYINVTKGYLSPDFVYPQLALWCQLCAREAHADEMFVTEDNQEFWQYRIWFD